jgi:hypothetical protein
LPEAFVDSRVNDSLFMSFAREFKSKQSHFSLKLAGKLAWTSGGIGIRVVVNRLQSVVQHAAKQNNFKDLIKVFKSFACRTKMLLTHARVRTQIVCLSTTAAGWRMHAHSKAYVGETINNTVFLCEDKFIDFVRKSFIDVEKSQSQKSRLLCLLLYYP